ncbi:TPA: hypothetical protein ACH3X3_014539 [Trebouxia sp. C0006]|jgi:microcystin-dependent protein
MAGMALANVSTSVSRGAVDLKAILNGPFMQNELGVEFRRIDVSPQFIFTLKILDGLTFPSLPANWSAIPKFAREPGFWVHVFLFITCEYAVSLFVNGGKPWWLEKVLVSLAWGAVLACLPSAAAFTIRRIWATRLSIYQPVAAVQPTTATSLSWVGQLGIGCADAAPDGWLLCNGQAVKREKYSQLFGVIKSVYGDGDGQTTFNVPNLQGRVAVGQSSEGSGFEKIGDIGGEVAHKLEVHEMPAHTHGVHDPGHRHHVRYCGRNYTAQGGKDSAFGANTLGRDGEGSGVGDTDPELSHISLQQAGSNVPHNNMPPFIVMCYFIKW